MTAAGRFWLAYLIGLFLLLCASQSHAGYYATITGSPHTNECWVGKQSGCYLTPSMALYSICSYSQTITALDPAAKTYTTMYQTNPTYGTYGECTATALGGWVPAFAGGISDPAITPNGISTGGSSGGTEEMFDTEIFTLASGAALLMFVTGFGIGLVIQLVRRLRTP